MPFNGPKDGDYSNVDLQQPPWVNGVMTLTSDECISVLERCSEISDSYNPADNFFEPLSDSYVIATYNKAVNFERGINGDTYAVLKGYDPERHTLGIDENGIVREAPEDEEPTGEEQPADEPTEEAPTDEPTDEAPEAPAEDEAPTGDDEQAGE